MPSILNFEIKEPPHKETGEQNPNFIYDEDVADIPIPEATPEDFTDDEEPVDLKQEIIDFVKKPEIVAEEIFSNVPVRKKGKATRSTSPKKTKRKPMSEEDKAKRRESLARGRETRMRNLAKKKQEQTAKELAINKVEPTPAGAYVTQSPLAQSPPPLEPEPEPQPQLQMRQSITAEDIERSQMNTLMAYEKMRKQRKQEKKKVKQIEEQQKQIKQTIQQVSASEPSWGSQRHRGRYGGMLKDMGL